MTATAQDIDDHSAQIERIGKEKAEATQAELGMEHLGAWTRSELYPMPWRVLRESSPGAPSPFVDLCLYVYRFLHLSICLPMPIYLPLGIHRQIPAASHTIKAISRETQ